MSTIADVISGAARWCVITADCRDVLRTIPAGSVDAVVTDPPYAISVEGSVHIQRPGKGTRNLDFFEGDGDWATMTQTVADAARATIPLMAEDASAYWWCGHRQFGALVAVFEEEDFRTRFLVWSKLCPPPPAPGSGWPSGAELCLYAYRPGRTWNFDGTNVPRSNVIVADGYRFGQPGKVDHPTQKPIVTMRLPIESCTKDGAVVLDPFCGSGTTGVACMQTGRRFIGIEIDPGYAAIARRRIAEAANHLFAGGAA